jgi:hypothetical protein
MREVSEHPLTTAQGSAVILQGRYIEHQALRALGTTERITMVTSFRPRSAHVRDDSVLTTVRAISDLSELYFGYGEYRLEIMEERIRAHLKEIRERKRAGRLFNTGKSTQSLLVCANTHRCCLQLLRRNSSPSNKSS